MPGAASAAFVRSIFPHASLIGGAKASTQARGMPGVARGLHRRGPATWRRRRPRATWRRRAASWRAVPPRADRPRRAAVRGRAVRDGRGATRDAEAADAAEVILRRGRGAARGARSGVRARRRRAAAVAGVRHERGPRVRARVGSRRARRAPTSWSAGGSCNQRVAPGADGAERHRGDPRRGRLDRLGAHAGAVRRPERPGRAARASARDRVHVIAPDVGGGFGAKLLIYPEYLAVARGRAAARTARAVDRDAVGEPAVASTTGARRCSAWRSGARRDGTLVGLRSEIVGGHGRLPGRGVPAGDDRRDVTRRVPLAGGRVPRVGRRHEHDAGHGLPRGGPARGDRAGGARDRPASRPSSDMDPVELRRRNLVPADAFPFTTATGMTYDSGDYALPLDEALRARGRRGLRDANSGARRAAGDRLQLGIGVASYVEITAFPSKDYAAVEVDAERRRDRPHRGSRRTGRATRPRSRRSRPASSAVPMDARQRACTPTRPRSSGARARGGRARCRSPARTSRCARTRSSSRAGRSRPRRSRWTTPTSRARWTAGSAWRGPRTAR